jgi:DNA invertase Pin-like site-specific DNA recombinase
MSARTNRQPVNPAQPATPDRIDPESLPPPMRRAYERYREPDARQCPKGDGAHLYCRVSSEEQSAPGRTSIDEQARLCAKALAGTGIPIVGIWRDEGFTGVSRLSERPVGRELFAVVKPGEIVVCHRVDRLWRNAMPGLADITELRQRGVGLLIAADSRWIPPAGGELDPIAEFNLLQGIVLAQLERDMLVARTEAGRRAQLQRGRWPWGVAPYGWKKEHDGLGHKLAEDENEQKILAVMLRCHRRGASVPKITDVLNEAGFRNRRGERFEYSGVGFLLRKYILPEAGTKSEGGAKSNKPKPNGNPTIGTASSSGISAVLQRKIRDAERVRPIIYHLIANQGCTSYRKLADALNFLEVPAPSGGYWYPSSVKNVMSTLNVTFASVLGGTPACAQKPAVEGLPRRPDRRERQAVRRLYRLPGNLRGRRQKATADVLFMRDRGATNADIARVLCLSRASVRAIIRQYPRWEIDDKAVKEQVLARHAAGEGPRKIARTRGLELRQVHRLIGVAQWQVIRSGKRVPALTEDRRAAILDLRRQRKTGLEIFAELGIDTEPERRQAYRFLRRQARHEPGLAFREPPALADEIAAAKIAAKRPEDYIRRDDYFLVEYWADKWNAQPPEVAEVARLLEEGQPIAEIVLRTGLTRSRVKYIRAALQSGRMRSTKLVDLRVLGNDLRCEPTAPRRIERAARRSDQDREGWIIDL